MITENKLNIATIFLHTNITERMVKRITTNNLITHTTAKTTKTNAPEMIAADHPQEITPTPRRAAQAITTETAHNSMTRRRNTRKFNIPSRSKQHHIKVTNV
jgi:CMP-2-keto-3-deoxyoctulosonic acid synthetase